MVFCFLTLLLFWSSTENSCLICQAAADNPNRKEGFDKTVKNKSRAGHSRTAIITTTSMVGIAVNALMAAVKVVIGQITGSLAVSFDGVNNLTDAGSSVITLISTKLAEREPDKQHPYGFGRTEYLSNFVIAMIILYAGISSLSESVQKLLRGGVPSYSSLSLWILLLAVVSKIGRDCTPFPRRKRLVPDLWRLRERMASMTRSCPVLSWPVHCCTGLWGSPWRPG